MTATPPLRPDDAKPRHALTKDNWWAQIPEWVLLNPGLSLGARVLYGVIDRFANKRNVAWPGQKTLGAILDVSDRQVRRYQTELEEIGALKVTPRAGGSNLYTLITARPEALEPADWDHYEPDDNSPEEAIDPGHTRPDTPDTSVRTLRTPTSATPDTSVRRTRATEPEPKNQGARQKSSSSSALVDQPSDDDDRIAEAARLHATDALDARRLAEANGKTFAPIGDVEAWLNATAERWTSRHRARALELLQAWPATTAEQLPALLDEYSLPAPPKPSPTTTPIAPLGCDNCDQGWNLRHIGNEPVAIPCPNCLPNHPALVSGGNIPTKASA